MTEGQYSPVQLKQARLLSSLLYGTRKQKIHGLWQNPDQERTNQNARIYLQDYVAV